MLGDNPTKAEELAHWWAFVNGLPKCSYLALYLHGSEDMLRNAMAQDMSTELIPAIRKARYEALADLAEAEKAKGAAHEQLRSLKAQVDALRRDAVNLRTELREARDASAALCRQSAEAFDRAVRVCIGG